MGNQHSAPDKEKEREKEKEKEKDKDREREKERAPARATSGHEKHRSKTIATPLPPAETKVNAEQTHNASSTSAITSIANSISFESKVSHEIPPKPSPSATNTTPGSVQTSPVKGRRMSKTKEIIDAIKNINLKNLPRPTEEGIKNQTETEHTPKFETVRAASETSLVDEDELKDADKSSEKVPLVLDWNEGGKKVAVAGTFTGWRKRVNLKKTNGGFSAILQVRPGTHRFHFLVDGEWRISNEFATAVDSEGNLLNYFQATEYINNEDFEYSHSASMSWPEPEIQKEAWTRTIPRYIVRIPDTSSYNGRYSSRSPLEDDSIGPPALPRQLEKPFLNQNHVQKDDQSVLPNPAHVVLNHLGVATSIKDNVLAVSCTNRYRQKYVTSILYKQVDED